MSIDNEKRLAMQSARQNSLESQARKKAVAIYEALRPFARGFHNTGNQIEVMLAKRILEEKPLSFVGFWGVGGKEMPDVYDEALFFEFGQIDRVVRGTYDKGVAFQLVLADEHGRFNGFSPVKIYEYLVRVKDSAGARGIGGIWLSDLYRQWGLSLPNPQEPPDIKSGVNADLRANFHYYYLRQYAQLTESAQRHHQSAIDPEQVAHHYVVMRLQEAPYLAVTFPESILLVNASKDLAKPLLPKNMPHMYSKTGAVWFQKG